jgi:hypothetical protein
MRQRDVAIVELFAAGAAEWNAKRPRPTSGLKISAVEILAYTPGEQSISLMDPLGARSVWRECEDWGLRGFDLEGTVWSGAHVDCDLSESNWAGAKLHQCDLYSADICRAQFGDARNVSFSGWRTAVDANFEVARFKFCALDSCRLEGAALAGWRVQLCSFFRCDFKGARGLDGVAFSGPCSFDSDTIASLLSEDGGQDFLVRAGFDLSALGEMRRLLSRPRGLHSVFMSYCSANREVAIKLDDLLTRAGVRCWRDEHEILPGDDLLEKIGSGVDQADKVLLLCSKPSLDSWWVEREVEKALEKERLTRESVLVPVDLDGAVWKWQSGKGSVIRSRNIADLRDWGGDAEHPEIARLLAALLFVPAGHEGQGA